MHFDIPTGHIDAKSADTAEAPFLPQVLGTPA